MFDRKLYDPLSDPYSENVIDILEAKKIAEGHFNPSFIDFVDVFGESFSIDGCGRRIIKIGNFKFVELLNNKDDQRLHFEGIIRFLNQFKRSENECVPSIYHIKSVYDSDNRKKQSQDLGTMAVFDEAGNYIAQFISYQYLHPNYRKPFLRARFRTSTHGLNEKRVDMILLIKKMTSMFVKYVYPISYIDSGSMTNMLLYYYSKWFFLYQFKHQKTESFKNDISLSVILPKISMMDIFGLEKANSDEEDFYSISSHIEKNQSTVKKVKSDIQQIIDYYSL